MQSTRDHEANGNHASIGRDDSATILTAVRAIGPTLRSPAHRRPSAAGRHSDETIADLDAAGAFNIASPAEFGGDELSVRQQLEVVTEVCQMGRLLRLDRVGWRLDELDPRRIGRTRRGGSVRPQMGRPAGGGLEPFSRVARPRQAHRGWLDHQRRALDVR